MGRVRRASCPLALALVAAAALGSGCFRGGFQSGSQGGDADTDSDSDSTQDSGSDSDLPDAESDGDDQGDADSSEVVEPGDGTSGTANMISSGATHVCALLGGGAVACWGSNGSGQLGDGTTTHRSTPVLVHGLDPAVAVSAGFDLTCALTKTGRVACWGSGSRGQLGAAAEGVSHSVAPQTIIFPGAAAPTAVSAGGEFACALVRPGEPWCWGANDYGQLGNATTDDSDVPVSPGNVSDLVQISAGFDSACAVRASGEVLCWGNNDHGQLGIGTTGFETSPVTVPGLEDTVLVSVGRSHACALQRNGKVDCFGSNATGQVGGGEDEVLSPRTAGPGLGSASDTCATWRNSCAVDSSGGAMCWGDDDFGQLGTGGRGGFVVVPVAVRDLESPIALSGGDGSACALLEGGAVSCWGRNDRGQVGDRTTEVRLLPVAVAGLP